MDSESVKDASFIEHLSPKQECMFCKNRGAILKGNVTNCLVPSVEVKGSPAACWSGIWDYPNEYALQSKITRCPNWERR